MYHVLKPSPQLRWRLQTATAQTESQRSCLAFFFFEMAILIDVGRCETNVKRLKLRAAPSREVTIWYESFKIEKTKCNHCYLKRCDIKAFRITPNECCLKARSRQWVKSCTKATVRHAHNAERQHNPPTHTTISALTSLLTKRVVSHPLPIPQTPLHTALVCCKCTKCILQLMFP